jgi:uncharacterized protein (TIGR00297 family)
MVVAAAALVVAFRVQRRFRMGTVLYAVAVLALLVVFFDRPDIAAAAWAILAWGYGTAALVRRRAGATAGSVTFLCCGGAAGALLAWWCRPQVVPPPYSWFSIVAPIAGAIAAGAMHRIPIRLPAVLSVPFTAAAVMWAISLVSEDSAAAALAAFAAAAPAAIAINAAAALTGYLARTVTRSGAAVGAVIGVFVLLSTGWPGWALLLITFGCAALTSRIGLGRKTALDIAEPRGGRRGAGSAVANTAVATAAGLLSMLSYAQDPALIAFVAALAAAGSDTIASEIGKAFGSSAFVVTEWRWVAAGTPGAMSIEGTLAGVCGAFGLAASGAALGLIEPRFILAAAAGAIVGGCAESVLAATLEKRGFLDNNVLNFLNTAVAAAAAIWLSGLSR